MTMRLAVMADKPSLARVYRDVIADRNPAAALSDTPVLYHHWEWMSGVKSRFRLPRGLNWSDYPIVKDHAYRELPVMKAEFAFRDPKSGSSFLSGEDLIAGFRAADKIVVLTDHDPSSVHPAQLYLRRILGDGSDVENHWVRTETLCEKELLNNYESPLSPEYLSDCFRSGEIRRFFDYNYIVNSLAIMGEAARRAGFYDVVPSKYGLQALLHMDPDATPLVGEIICRMGKWEGTGKYDPQTMNYASLGSPASRHVILEYLMHGDFLDKVGKNRVRISEGGRRFIELLHPRCRDSDLPFRIEEWSRLPLDEAKEKIGRYLRTFFGRQKRYLEKVS